MDNKLEYNEGYTAYLEGRGLLNNPYKHPEDADKFDAWQEGFFAAQDSED